MRCLTLETVAQASFSLQLGLLQKNDKAYTYVEKKADHKRDKGRLKRFTGRRVDFLVREGFRLVRFRVWMCVDGREGGIRINLPCLSLGMKGDCVPEFPCLSQGDGRLLSSLYTGLIRPLTPHTTDRNHHRWASPCAFPSPSPTSSASTPPSGR